MLRYLEKVLHYPLKVIISMKSENYYKWIMLTQAWKMKLGIYGYILYIFIKQIIFCEQASQTLQGRYVFQNELYSTNWMNSARFKTRKNSNFILSLVICRKQVTYFSYWTHANILPVSMTTNSLTYIFFRSLVIV